jgi:uroporphyrin-III C-methyltransferase
MRLPGEQLGTVYLVGAGPGAPDLLTVRAARLLEQADIVFHDALVHPETVALAARAEKVPVGKRCGRHSAAQRFINKRLIDAAHKHRVVVRLKGGDPMVFGRSQEEIDALTAAGIAVEVVPGVTAALAAAAQLRVSLTRRGLSRSLTLVTPRAGSGTPDHAWSAALSPADTIAIYMGAGQAQTIQQTLLEQGYCAHTPIAICESVSLPDARTLRGQLADLAAMAAQLDCGPALILVGKVFATASAARAEAAATTTLLDDSCRADNPGGSAAPAAAVARAISRSAR